MCGIFGRYAYSVPISEPKFLIAAVQMLRHRGPDGGAYWHEGKYFLGHRRLSIIDIDSGMQPMATDDGRYVITFNGEIYNYIELRNSLIKKSYAFHTQSDTEVILNAYRAWGTDMPRYLTGMFAFAIVDRKEHTLFLARDRFGEKPLFVVESSEYITFASELSALTRLPDIIKTQNLQAVAEYLCLNYVPSDQSLIKEIRRLPPASWRLYKNQCSYQESYWQLPTVPNDVKKHTLQQNIHELKAKLDQAVSMTLRSDVPITLFLSGGIDSSIVAESAVRQGKLKHAYCLDFNDKVYSEFSNAQKVANTLKIELRRVLLDENVLQDFFALCAHANDPLGDSSALAVWKLASEAAKDYRVAITGDGCDELFGGYLTYRATYLQSLLYAYLPGSVLKRLGKFSNNFCVSDGKVSISYKLMRYLRSIHLKPNGAHFTWNGAWMPNSIFEMLPDMKESYSDEAKFLMSLCNRYSLSNSPTIRDCRLVDSVEYLPNDILVKLDRMTMAHGLEARAPCLNQQIAEFAFKLPDQQIMQPFGKSKIILRELACQIFGPGIAYAKKQGFSIPIHVWLRNAARDLLETLLSAPSLQSLPFLNAEPILRAKKQHLLGKRQLGFELWGLMVLVAWHQTHMQAKSPVLLEAGLKKVDFGVFPKKNFASSSSA